MSSFNKVFLMGNLTKDPDLKFTAQGMAVANFSIAVNRATKTGAGEMKKLTDFFNIVAWGKLGETCAKYLPKGRSVHIEGRLQTRSYETRENQKRHVTEIVAETIQFLGGNPKTTMNRELSEGQHTPEAPAEGANDAGDGVPF